MDEMKLEENKDFVLINARTEDGSKELLELGGQQQVPFLVDGDVKMYESDDIIEYIKTKFK